MNRRRMVFVLIGVGLGASLAYYLGSRPSRRERDWISHMTNDLRLLDSLQTAYKARNQRYTDQVNSALSFNWTTGVTPVSVAASVDGWTATVKHAAASEICTIAVGSAVKAGEPSGQPTCR